MLKKTLVSIAVLSTLSITSANALELGELTAISKADEPFKAEIQLLDVNALTAKDVRIRLGSESEFRQAEITPNRILSRLKFQVKQPSKGKLVVEVVSNSKLDIDSLDFVLSARWPSGKVVRGYKVPLKESVLVENTGGEVVQSSKVAKSNNKVNRTTFVDARNLLESMPTNGTYKTTQGNTLWSLADKNNPNAQLTVYQTMMAIQALNEDAFYANNINLMKEGAILRLPTQEQVALFNKAMSKQEFDKQNQAWMDLKRNGQIAKEIESAQLNTQAKSKPANKVRGIAKDTLSLISGASMLPEGAASSNNGGAKKIAQLEQKLSATQENLDKESREKEELNQKLNDLNSQLSTLEELISLKDAQLAELQQQLMSAQNTLQEQKNTVDQLLEADQLRREKELEEESSIVNQILSNPIFLSIGAVILLLIGLLVGLLIKRSSQKKDEGDELSDFDLASQTVAPVAVAEAVSQEETTEPEEDEDDPFSFDFDGAVGEESNQDGANINLSDDPFAEENNTDEDTSFDETAFDDDIDFDLDDDPEPVTEEDFGFDLDEPQELEVVEDEDIPTIDTPMETNLPEEEEVADTSFDDAFDSELDDAAMEDIDASLDTDLGEMTNQDESDLDDSEEADFVNNLLSEIEDESDVDETALFDEDPNESLVNSIEESLKEAQGENPDDDLDIPTFTENDAAEEESDEEEEFDFFDASGDEVATKLDLARAYMDMGDEEGARVILEDVLASGNESQITEAQSMIDRMSPSE